MAYANLLIDRGEGHAAIVTITINRPKVLNALNGETLDELSAALDEIAADAAARVVILTGAGDKSFVAGADISELAVQTPVGGRDHARRGQRLFDRIERFGKPIVAAVNGFALGGGCELAMACTVRLAADTARFGQPEINLGLIPGYAGTQRLARLIGRGRALEWLLTGDMVTADEAWRVGLVNRPPVPTASLMDEARKLAATLAAKPPVAVRFILDAVASGLEMPFAEAEDHEATLFGLVSTTHDMREGTRAFLEKRKPTFSGS
jgi:enoyl-CoA hydratase